MYYLVAKNSSNIWALYGVYENYMDATLANNKFRESMYLLNLFDSRVIEEDSVMNKDKIGWENDILFISP